MGCAAPFGEGTEPTEPRPLRPDPFAQRCAVRSSGGGATSPRRRPTLLSPTPPESPTALGRGEQQGHSPLTSGGKKVRLTPHTGPEREEDESERESLEGPALGDLTVLPFSSHPSAPCCSITCPSPQSTPMSTLLPVRFRTVSCLPPFRLTPGRHRSILDWLEVKSRSLQGANPTAKDDQGLQPS